MADYISRQKAIESIMDLPNCPNGYSDTYDKECIIGILEEVPTADVLERKRGKWEGVTMGRWIYAKCSVCGTVHDTQTKFCPSCGAEMEATLWDISP